MVLLSTIVSIMLIFGGHSYGVDYDCGCHLIFVVNHEVDHYVQHKERYGEKRCHGGYLVEDVIGIDISLQYIDWV